MEIKYEKIDSNNIRKYLKFDPLVKQDLQDLSTDYQQIKNLPDSRIEILNEEFKLFNTVQSFQNYFQAKQDEVDALLDIFNNATTSEEIDWIDEWL